MSLPLRHISRRKPGDKAKIFNCIVFNFRANALALLVILTRPDQAYNSLKACMVIDS